MDRAQLELLKAVKAMPEPPPAFNWDDVMSAVDGLPFMDFFNTVIEHTMRSMGIPPSLYTGTPNIAPDPLSRMWADSIEHGMRPSPVPFLSRETS